MGNYRIYDAIDAVSHKSMSLLRNSTVVILKLNFNTIFPFKIFFL